MCIRWDIEYTACVGWYHKPYDSYWYAKRTTTLFPVIFRALDFANHLEGSVAIKVLVGFDLSLPIKAVIQKIEITQNLMQNFDLISILSGALTWFPRSNIRTTPKLQFFLLKGKVILKQNFPKNSWILHNLNGIRKYSFFGRYLKFDSIKKVLWVATVRTLNIPENESAKHLKQKDM